MPNYIQRDMEGPHQFGVCQIRIKDQRGNIYCLDQARITVEAETEFIEHHSLNEYSRSVDEIPLRRKVTLTAEAHSVDVIEDIEELKAQNTDFRFADFAQPNAKHHEQDGIMRVIRFKKGGE